MTVEHGLFQRWVLSHPPERTFLSTAEGRLTYGDVGSETPPGPTGQTRLEPGEGLDTIVGLVTVPGPRRQLVVVDPRLPPEERQRRSDTASRASGREALTILFTSGSSGLSKGVRLTAANWQAAAEASAAHLGHRPDDVWLAAMPLHHVAGLSILYRTALVGARVRWLPRFDPAAVVEELRGDVTIASLVPTMLRRVLEHDRGRFGDVRAVLVGGGPIPDGLLEEAHRRGLPALPTYGMTETCAQVATLRPGSGPRRAAHLLPGIEVRIGVDQVIEIRGRQVSPGYADEDDRPPGEWFVTADRGSLEPDGALTVLGRADRVIVTGGENVDPARVESVLGGHPEVRAVAVVGVEDPEWGRAVGAVYEGTVSPSQLREWARPRLAGFELPRRLRRVDRIPTVGPSKPDPAALERLLREDPPGPGDRS